MNLVQLTPGAGRMYCGNCFRDNALVAQLRRLGHEAHMVPLYLPLTLDEPDQSSGSPIFFGGVNVYLDQVSALHRRAPAWARRWLDAPALLRWAAGRAAKTRPADVGALTVSMLRGEQGNQNRELDDLIGWLQRQARPEVVCLSNALLIGMARRIRAEVGAAVVCLLAGEDAFLDALPPSHRAEAWATVAERASDVALFLPPSQYYGDLMARRLPVADRLAVVPSGIALTGYDREPARLPAPALGYFARMCPEKGLDRLVEAFILLKQRGRVKNLKLRIGGGCGPGDEPFVKTLRQRLAAAGYLGETGFQANLSRAEKLDFLRGLSVFSVPAHCGEAFGLYVVEALAAGVPVVQPRVAAFPELLAATGGGLLCAPNSPQSLADGIEALLLDPARARALGAAGRAAVFAQYSVERMAENTLSALERVRGEAPGSSGPAHRP